MKYEKKSEWGEVRALWPISLPEIKAWQWWSKITQKQMPSFLFLCNFAWFLYFLSYILSGILDLSATMDPEINEWNENCWISLAISNLKWIGCFLRSTEKKTSPLNSNTIIWDRIFVSSPSKYWLLLLMKLNILEFLNDSKILIKQWKRSQFCARQLIMICNKNFNNAGYKHNSDLIDLLLPCFFQQFTFHICVGFFKPSVTASV